MELALLLEQCLAPVPGGTGRYSRELAAALARTAAPADRVTGWTAWHRDTAAARVPGVAGPHRLPLGRRALVAAWDRGLGPRPRGDVVHAPTPLAPPVGPALAFRTSPRRDRGRGRTGRPLVVTVHDAVPFTHPETLTARGAHWHRRAIRRAAATADLVVVPTRAVADQLSAHVGLPRLLVVGEGVSDALAVPPDAQARRSRLQLPLDYLLSVATLEPRKGLDVLLDALALPGAPQLPLLVAGQPGWGGIDLPAEAARRGLPAGRVRLLGRVPDPDLAVLLSGATALAAPSRAEGFGLPVLEAMALGTPVVTSSDAALVEVGGGATLVAADGADALCAALRTVVQDETLRDRLSAAGRERAKDFTWEAAATTLWGAYFGLLSQ